MKVYQKNITNTNTLSVCLPHPPLTHRTSTSPLSVRLAINSGTDENCPDRKTLNTKVTQNESTNTDTIPIRSPHPSNTTNIEPSPPPPDCLSDKRSGTVRVPE